MLGFYRRPLVVALFAISWIGAIACGDDDDPPSNPPAAAGEGGEGGSGTGTGGGGKGGSNPAGGAGGEGQPGEPGIRTVGVAPLRTSESGGQETFAIVLDARPTANVTIPLESSNEDEGTVAPGSVTFTPANWNAPQIITVTGVDDDDADGDTAYTIEVGPAQSSDGSYDGLEGDAVELTNTDNETAGITVDADADLTTSEGGGQATFRVVLNAAPSGDVRIPLASDDVGEGTVTPVFLLFTPQNWNAPKVVTIHGVDDAQKDGDQEYSIVLAAAESSDSNYDGLNADDVSLTNIDNETAGVTLDFGAGLSTSEDGGDATFRIALNAQPTANVTFSLESSDEGEGLAAPTSITFTPANWNAPQVITVTGVDDDEVDGPQPYTIEIGSATSSDSAYSGLAGGSVPLLNEDDETAGVELQGVGALQTSESGGDASFTVRLRAQPGANVTLRLTSSDTGEGIVTPGSLVFTPANWDAPRTVTISGVDDDLDDGNQVYTIVTAALTSSDPNYDGIGVLDLTVTNIDNDTPGITVFPLTAETTEAGGDDTFRVVLNSEPTANVTIDVESAEETEGLVSPGTLTFTPANWDAPQFVTVTGQNDDLDDGNQVYFVELLPAESTDPGYDGVDGQDVEVTNTDDETAGITVDPTDGLVTTEAGAGDDTFTVVLNSEPTDDVVIDLSSSDPDEGTPDPATITFTPANWDAPQTITVTGEDDDLDDGDQIYTIELEAATSDDDNYDGMIGDDVDVSNTDDETAGITVDPTDGLVTTEAGAGDDTFTVVLNSEPTDDVTITLSSSEPDEGTPDPASITFTPANWDAPQTITVTGEDDDLDDGDQTYTIELEAATSDDDNYDGMIGDDVDVSNTDDETAGITVDPTDGLVTTEAGAGDDTFTVVLNSEPTDDVTITLSSSEPDEGTPDPASITFTPANWDAPQTITVTGEDDDLDDGDQTYTIELAAATSDDDNYDGMIGDDVDVSNTDDETAGITVDPTDGLVTTEAGAGDDTFTVVLNSEPTDDVTITLSSSDPDEGTPDPASITFTPANWDTAQTITVTGEDDDLDDGDQTYTIELAAATSDDDNYDGVVGDDVDVSNTDDETAGITVDPTDGLVTTEAGAGTDTFTVVLNSEPTDDVVIDLTSSDPDEGTPDPATITFTPANWDTPQTITVTGEDDVADDGDQTYTIELAAAVSDDDNYDGMVGDDVDVSNTDNDPVAMFGISVDPTSGLESIEGQFDDSFSIVLTSAPTGDVTINFSVTMGSHTVRAEPGSVTFTTMNWNTPQDVLAFYLSDGDSMDDPFVIDLLPATSTDSDYNGLDGGSVSGMVLEGDI